MWLRHTYCSSFYTRELYLYVLGRYKQKLNRIIYIHRPCSTACSLKMHFTRRRPSSPWSHEVSFEKIKNMKLHPLNAAQLL